LKGVSWGVRCTVSISVVFLKIKSIPGLDNHAKTRVMVLGVVTGLGAFGRLATTHNASGTAISRARRLDGVFAVKAPGLPGQKPFPVAKDSPVLLVGERTPLMDEPVGLLTFGWQRGQCDNRPIDRFGWRPGVHQLSACPNPRYQSRQRPAPGKQGLSNHHQTPFKSTGLTRTLKGVSVMHCTKKSKGLPEKQAGPGRLSSN